MSDMLVSEEPAHDQLVLDNFIEDFSSDEWYIGAMGETSLWDSVQGQSSLGNSSLSLSLTCSSTSLSSSSLSSSPPSVELFVDEPKVDKFLAQQTAGYLRFHGHLTPRNPQPLENAGMIQGQGKVRRGPNATCE
eukprot:gene8699-9584_t